MEEKFNLFLWHTLVILCEHTPQILQLKPALASIVKSLKSFHHLFVNLTLSYLFTHQQKEFVILTVAIVVVIHICDHFLKLCVGGVLPDGSEHNA